jgi:peptidoglycan biosynthesis protein MviN/MurJ (putative lipid II flippase)
MIDSLKKLYKYNFISVVLGLINLLILLKYVGISERTDLFFGALIVISSFSRILMSGFFNEIVVPIYTNLYQTKRKYSFFVISTFITAFLVIASVMMLVLIIFSGEIINTIYYSMSEEELTELKFIFRLLLPQIILLVFNELISSVLNSIGIYGRQELSRIYSSLSYMVIVLFLYHSIDIYALVIAAWTSYFIQLFYLLHVMNKTDLKIFIFFRKRIFKKYNLVSKLNIAFLYVIISQFFSLLLRSYIATFGEGFITIIHYVQNIVAKLRAVIIKPFLTILLTEFSLAERSEHFRRDVGRLKMYILGLITTVLGLALIIKSYGIYFFVNIVKFDQYNQLIGFKNIIWFYVALLSLDIIYGIFRKRVVAQGMFNIFYKGMIASQLFNIVIVYVGVINNIIHIRYIFLIIFLDIFVKLLWSYYLYIKRIRIKFNSQ